MPSGQRSKHAVLNPSRELEARVKELQAYTGHLESTLEHRTAQIKTAIYLNLVLTIILTALVLGIVARAIGL